METYKCKKCGSDLPLSEFSRHALSKTGHMNVCRRCIAAAKQKSSVCETEAECLPQSSDPRLAPFEARELIAELRRRGYKGRLEYRIVKTIEL